MPKIKYFQFILLTSLAITLLSIFFISCDSLADISLTKHTLHITVPALPPNLKQNAAFIDFFILSWFDEQFSYRQRIIPRHAIVRTPNADNLSHAPISISIAQNTPTPIMLTPVAINGARFSPAGAIVPLRGVSGERGRNHHATLSWENGCAIIPLVHAFPGTNGLYGFNVNRYVSLVQNLTVEDRCLIDYENIILLLRNGSMRSSAIRTRPLNQFDIQLPRGHWVPANLFHKPIMSDGVMHSALPPLPYGTFHFFEPEQNGYVRISLTEQEQIIVHNQDITVRNTKTQ